LQPSICIQGNLDPIMLVTGGPPLQREATRILDKLGHGSFIFNLGHGVVPQTPPSTWRNSSRRCECGSRRS
jgi:uroporphyrinogen decarboxylase